MKQATSSQPSQPTTQQTSVIRSSKSQSALVSIQLRIFTIVTCNNINLQEGTKPVKPVETKPTPSLSKNIQTQSTPAIKPNAKPLQSTGRSESKTNKKEVHRIFLFIELHEGHNHQEYLAWLNKYLKPIGEHADDLEESVAGGVYVLLALGVG